MRECKPAGTGSQTLAESPSSHLGMSVKGYTLGKPATHPMGHTFAPLKEVLGSGVSQPFPMTFPNSQKL